MPGGLPSTVDPILLADQGARLSGWLSLRNLSRLKTQLVNDTGEAQIDLAFERSGGANLRRMHGRIVANVGVTCQRCLEPMTIEITATPDAILLRADEPDPGLPPEADVVMLPAAPLPVAELIEDELLLALPMVPMHALEECPARRYIGAAPDSESESKSSREKIKRPFAKLMRGKPEDE